MQAQLDNFSGTWHCRYWFKNTKQNDRLDISEYLIKIERIGNHYVLHSLPEANGSHLEARFTVDNRIIMGTWMENTAPRGEWFGMMYKGAFQLLRDKDQRRMKGQWIAAVYNNANPEVHSGPWEIAPADEDETSKDTQR